MVFAGLYPDQVIRWLRLVESPYKDTLYELLELRTMTIADYLCYRYLPNMSAALA
jgi:hypothetical protein